MSQSIAISAILVFGLSIFLTPIYASDNSFFDVIDSLATPQQNIVQIKTGDNIPLNLEDSFGYGVPFFISDSVNFATLSINGEFSTHVIVIGENKTACPSGLLISVISSGSLSEVKVGGKVLTISKINPSVNQELGDMDISRTFGFELIPSSNGEGIGSCLIPHE